MKRAELTLRGLALPAVTAQAVVVGSGCAGYNAADCLWNLGVRDVALLTEGVRMGTSRNTGSDKQTYYKLSLSGSDGDSVRDLAETLYGGGGVDGDIALCEAAGSARGFLKLVQLGVPFPTNEYGEYVGYQTDHDTRRRATSCGPLTSRLMTEALERAVSQKGIPVLDRMTVVRLLADEKGVHGLLCLDGARAGEESFGLTAVLSEYIVLATGGPAIVYRNSVYPQSQTGMTGMALEAGAAANNLQDWQYGLASVKFRWNVSGTYQQALPRYVSVDEAGEEHDFLAEAIPDPRRVLLLCFRKGYQWPFDAAKAGESSLVDLLVHREIFGRGRRVYLDFRRNPAGLEDGFDLLPEEARTYLANSGALLATPVERLAAMNPGALALYAAHQIDLKAEMLEISVCAQHCSGGLEVDRNWQTTVPGLYAAGEAAGTFGAVRPGGSALNSTQVGSLRAAEHIARSLRAGERQPAPEAADLAVREADDLLARLRAVPAESGCRFVREQRERFQRAMSESAAYLRGSAMAALQGEAEAELARFWETARFSARREAAALLKNRDMLLTQAAVLSAMELAREAFGSRGSGLCLADPGEAAGAPVSGSWPALRALPRRGQKENLCVRTRTEQGRALSGLRPARPIPESDQWFERVWRGWREAWKEE